METRPFRSVLFAVDGAEESAHAAPLVARYARDWQARLHLLHVHRLDQAGAARDRDTFVGGMVEAMCDQGVRATGEVRLAGEGDVAATVAHVARLQEVDLVAVGSHGRGGVAGLLLPSVSRDVASGLNTPVLIARVTPGARARSRRLLLAIDASEGADRAVADAIRFARPTGMAVRVVHVLDGRDGDDAGVGRALDRASTSLRRAGLDGSHDVVLAAGSVPEAIAAAARRCDADVVALASRRPGRVRGFVVGSVAHQLMQVLDRPVLLAHRPPS
jgi:nucleotide-binding universal stress UspA family protein